MVSAKRVILHVDDDSQVTRLVGRKLQGHAFEVISLNDPTLAIDELGRTQARIALIDIDMPGINGLDLLRQIKAYDGGIQVIILTGVVTMTSVLQSLRLGAEACFFKPITDFTPLVTALEDAHTKLERWWVTLEELSHRRRAEQQLLH